MQVPQFAGLHPGPLDVLVDVLAAESHRPSALRSGRHGDLCRKLASVNQGVDGVELEAEQLARDGGSDPVVAGRARHEAT